jgi:peptidoglycan/xylan/chitin deacetylase (PgdA/CDA1 family)
VFNLTFHGIGDAHKELNPGERRVWMDLSRFQSVLDSVVGQPAIRLTFDDGNASDVALALPELLGRNLRATFFLLAGKIDRPGYVDSAGVRELIRSGMGVGTHGLDHRDWRRVDDVTLKAVIVDSVRILGELAGQAVTRASCPFGSYARRVLRFLRRAGLERVFTSDRGWASEDEWLQTRNTIDLHGEPRVSDLLRNDVGIGVLPWRRRLWRVYKRWR